MSGPAFDRYFTLEEAVSLLPEVKASVEKARASLDELRDDAILFQRILLTRQEEGEEPSEEALAVLKEKADAFECSHSTWVSHFKHQGIVLRDLSTGLIDFPYHSETTNSDYFLCWRPDEDGILYFHSVSEGFGGRKPITLLPD